MMLIFLFLMVNLVNTQSPPPSFGPPSQDCPPLTNCDLSCPYRFRLDSNRCEICECRTSPCINETAILPNVQCDRTSDGPKCPSTHDCVVQGGGRPWSQTSGSPPPTPSPTTRGVCCIHVDLEALGIRPPPTRFHRRLIKNN